MNRFKDITSGEWKNQTFLNSKIKYRHVITSSNGDTVARILRDDSDNSEQQLADAELIVFAGNLAQKYNIEAFEEMYKALDEARTALELAIHTTKTGVVREDLTQSNIIVLTALSNAKL